MRLPNIERLLRRWRSLSSDLSAAEPAEEPGLSKWSALIPHLLAVALISAALVLAVLHFTGGAVPRLVVFDIIKYANAQRAVAERFVKRRDTDQAAILLDLSQRTRRVIDEVAGPRALVVIRQAIVQGETRDITDEVLRQLGLPTDVPTADPTKYVLDVAPTLLGSGPRMAIEEPSDSSPRHLELP